jgi:hypothetical protein
MTPKKLKNKQTHKNNKVTDFNIPSFFLSKDKTTHFTKKRPKDQLPIELIKFDPIKPMHSSQRPKRNDKET